jgi:Asp-tRNA(Asn)/Glu-tRNA(Gln) amidotransferase A subunit family amidase
MTTEPRTARLVAAAPLAVTATALRSGDLGVPDYIEAVCDRIEEVEPRIRSLLPEPGRRARLRAEAAALLARFPEPESRPPLFGVLVGVKDIIAVDGFETRAGSMVPAESFSMREGTAVRRLREAGALVLGKTVTTEFAGFDPGPTANPHATGHTPGGSSSGSAAAVAGGLAPLALGSQTVGSVIRPAAFCGLVGVKPSFGRIPLDGVLDYSRSVDHLGLFTQDVAGARLAASVLCDGWRELEAAELPRPVIGVPEGAYLDQAEPEGLEAFRRQLERLEVAGYEVRRVPMFEDIEALTARHRAVTVREFAEVHRERSRAYGSLFRPSSAMTMDRAAEISDAAYAEGLASRGGLRDHLHAAMEAEGIDVWANPPAPGPAPRGLGSTGNPAMNLPWTHAGVPAITIPAGAVEDGRPLGLQLAARFGEDERLLAWAEEIEAVLAAQPR